jgi:ribosome-associated protein
VASRGLVFLPPHRSPPIESKVLAATLARWCQEKKAEHIRAYAVGERLGLSDYFLLVTGLNKSHVRALQNELHVRAKPLGLVHHPAEGANLHWWVVMDFGNVVVHLLQPEARAFYDLDRLYMDCKELDWEAVVVPASTSAAEA